MADQIDSDRDGLSNVEENPAQDKGRPDTLDAEESYGPGAGGQIRGDQVMGNRGVPGGNSATGGSGGQGGGSQGGGGQGSLKG